MIRILNIFLFLLLSGCGGDEASSSDITNRAPTINTLAMITAMEGKLTTVQVFASDQDNDDLVYSLLNHPSWVSIKGNMIFIRPSSEHVGSYTFKVQVSDGFLSDETNVNLVVSQSMIPVDPDLVNHAPTINALPAINAAVGRLTIKQVIASDQDNDTLTYDLVNNPNWISMENNLISIQPSSEHVGDHSFKVKVSDGHLSAETDMMVKVQPLAMLIPSNIPEADIAIRYHDGMSYTLTWSNTENTDFVKVTMLETGISSQHDNTMTEHLPESRGQLSLISCNEYGCSSGTEKTVRGRNEKVALNFNVGALEHAQKAIFSFRIEDIISGAMPRIVNTELVSGDTLLDDEIMFFSGDKVSFSFINTSNNQLCEMKDNIQDMILIDGRNSVEATCLTEITYQSLPLDKSYDISSGLVNISQPILLNARSEIIHSPLIHFSSSDPSIVSIDGDSLQLNKAGQVNVIITPATDYYKGEVKSFSVNVNQTPKDVRIETCQSNACLDITTPYAIASEGRKLLLRMYGIKGNYRFDIGDKFSHDVICNSQINFEQPSYVKNATCNIDIPAEQVLQNSIWTLKNSDTEEVVYRGSLNIEPKRKLIITLVPIKYQSGGVWHIGDYKMNSSDSDDVALANLKKLLLDKFPLSDIELRVREPFEVEFENSGTGNVLNAIAALRAKELGLTSSMTVTNHTYYALIPMEGFSSGTHGRAFLSGSAAVGIDGKTGSHYSEEPNCQAALGYCLPYFYHTIVHELGHTLSLSHAPCGIGENNYEERRWQNVEYAWWPGAKQGKVNNNPFYNQFYDDVLRSPYHKETDKTYWDAMGYCNGSYFAENSVYWMVEHLRKYGMFDVNEKTGKNELSLDEYKFKRLIFSLSENGGISFYPPELIVEQFTKSDSDIFIRAISDDGQEVYLEASNITMSEHDEIENYYSVDLPIDFMINKIMLLNSSNTILFEETPQHHNVVGDVSIENDRIVWLGRNNASLRVDIIASSPTMEKYVVALNSKRTQFSTVAGFLQYEVIFKDLFNIYHHKVLTMSEGNQ